MLLPLRLVWAVFLFCFSVVFLCSVTTHLVSLCVVSDGLCCLRVCCGMLRSSISSSNDSDGALVVLVVFVLAPVCFVFMWC